MNETTPITDKCPHCGAEPSPSGPDFKCGTWSLNQTGDRRSRLCEEREKRQKSELSRRRNIRRAWRFRKTMRSMQVQYKYASDMGRAIHKKELKELESFIKSLENDNFNLANALSAATRKSELWEKESDVWEKRYDEAIIIASVSLKQRDRAIEIAVRMESLASCGTEDEIMALREERLKLKNEINT